MHMYSTICCKLQSCTVQSDSAVHTLLSLFHCELPITPPAELTSNSSASMFAVT